MANHAGTLELVLQEVGGALATLQSVLQSDQFAGLLSNLGIDHPPDLSGDTMFTAKLAAAVDSAGTVGDNLETLAVAADEGSLSDVATAGGILLGSFGEVMGALDDVATDLARAASGFPDVVALSSTFSERVVEEVLTNYLEAAHPLTERVLRLLGIIERTAIPIVEQGEDSFIIRRRLFFSRLPTLFTDPVSVINMPYHWGTDQFDETPLIQNTEDLLDELGQEVLGTDNQGVILTGGLDDDASSPPQLDVLSAVVTKSSDSPPGLELDLGTDIGTDQQIVLGQVSDNWQVNLDLGGSYNNGLVAKLLPPLRLEFTPPGAGGLQGHLALQFTGQTPDPSGRITIMSITSGCKIDAQTVTAGLMADLAFDVGTGKATADLGFLFHLKGGRVLISQDPSSDDGFLAQVLPTNGAEIDFDFGVKWTPSQGLQIEGAAGLELNVPINRSSGPLAIATLDLAAQIDPQTVFFSAGATGSITLGPVVATVQNVGVGLLVDLKSRGSLASADLSVKFKPPTGVGLSIDAGSVHGRGFIALKDGQYTGALQLSIYDIAVNAFGLIDTKVPGVSYSFVIIISAQFTPIQLGFGFTLNGVGGMIGINRGIDTTALANLVRAGQSEALLFPKNVVADAPTIVRDLTTVFPATQGRYVFGPLGKLGWGTPTLITGEIGVILEIPGPVVVILGEVKCLLPKPDAPLVRLNVSVDGELDFPKKTFAMDAALHDSVINGYPVSGQMAMRVSWGDNPNFIFSIGGFHPAYTPPPDFPKLQPLAIDLASHGPAKLTVSGFFAVTSNTVQVGGTLSLHASGSGISLDALVSVKALFVFSPFSFEANVDASVKISFHGYGPSVHLSGVLDGPSPWHVKGQVCVSILWWDACLGFDVTFGGNQQVTQPTIDPWVGADADGSTPAIVGLHDALSDAGNWSGALVPGTVSSVTRAQGTDTLVDPVGGLTVRQKTAPVETPNPLTKFGVAKTPQPIKFSGVQATLGTGNNTVPLAAVEPVKEFFAPAQFFDMDDGKKLSSKAFEQYQAGYLFATATGNTQGGSRVTFAPQVQTIVLNGDGTQTPVATPYVPSSDAVAAANQRSAVAKGGLTQAGTRRFVNRAFTQAFTEQIPTFVIADVATLTTVTVVDVPIPAVRSATLIALDAFRAQHLELAAGVQVAAIHELAA